MAATGRDLTDLTTIEQFRDVLAADVGSEAQWWAAFISACNSRYATAVHRSAERREWGLLLIDVLDAARDHGVGMRRTFSRRVVAQLGLISEFGAVLGDPVLDPERLLEDAVARIGVSAEEFSARYERLRAHPEGRAELLEQSVILSTMAKLCASEQVRDLPAAKEWCAVVTELSRR